MGFSYVAAVPILIGIWFPITFVVTYFTAVYNQNTNPFFPFISDTGTWAPESCIFGQMLNMGALLMLLHIFIRYYHIKYLSENTEIKAWAVRWNHRALIPGCLAVLGVSIVGNFQETNLLLIHGTGAFFAFGLGTLYAIIQTRISFLVYPKIGIRSVNIFRVIASVICCLTACGAFSFAGLFFLTFTGPDISKFSEEYGGYDFHLYSSICEWILAMTTMAFLASFVAEYKSISINAPSVSERPKEQN